MSHDLSISEHRNMPLDDALTMIGGQFDEYLADMRKKAAAAAATPTPTPTPAPVSPVVPKSDFPPPSRNIQYLLNLVADSRFLSLQEIDELLDYLQARRKHLVGGTSTSKTASGGMCSGCGYEMCQRQSTCYQIFNDANSAFIAL